MIEKAVREYYSRVGEEAVFAIVALFYSRRMKMKTGVSTLSGEDLETISEDIGVSSKEVLVWIDEKSKEIENWEKVSDWVREFLK